MNHAEISIFPNNKMLFIDDDREFTDLMVEFFETTEFEIKIQNDSRVALNDIFDIKPFFVVLDYNMPYLNGLDILKEIRNSQYKNMHVIFLSAYIQYKEDVLRAGVDNFFMKGEDSRWIQIFYDYLKNVMDKNMKRVPAKENANLNVYILPVEDFISEIIEIDSEG